jgi:hypothetical protein
VRRQLGVVKRKKRQSGRGEGVRSGFIAARCLREERERERSWAKSRMAGGAGVLDGPAWQLLEIGGPTWKGEGTTADVARAVGGRRERRVGTRRAAQGCTAVACTAATARGCTGGRELTAGGGWRGEARGSQRKAVER